MFSTGSLLLLGSLALPSIAPLEAAKVTPLEEFVILYHRHGGSYRIEVREGSEKGRTLFSMTGSGQYLLSAREWPLPKKGRGVWLTLGYGTGSSETVAIVGPGARDRWKVLLKTDSQNAYNFPPEVVDLRGIGIRDIVTVSSYRAALIGGEYRFDPKRTACSVWRWNSSNQEYSLRAIRPYWRRLRER